MSLTLGWLLAIGWGYARAQADFVIERREHEAQQLKISANRWMLTPIDLRSQKDTATTSKRQARDLYWDQKMGTPAPLSDARATEPGHARRFRP